MREGWEEQPNVRRTVSLPRELCSRLVEEAARQERTVDELIAELLSRGLEEDAQAAQGS